MYYNFQLKMDYINYLVNNNKTSYRLFNKIFNSSAKIEEKLERDLFTFNKDDLLVLYNEFAKDMKNITIINYNFLIKDYKLYCSKKTFDNVCLDILETKDIKKIKCDKQYLILNDEEFNEIVSIPPENTEVNIILLLRLFWETDARVKPQDILSLQIQDVDIENNTVSFNNTKYSVSEDLILQIIDWSETTEVDFFNKGTYRVSTMEENKGYVFRSIKNNATKLGQPMKLANFDVALNKWSTKYLSGDILTIRDLTMSLALKYMLINFKTHTEMYTEQRYFQKTLSFIYQDIFNQYAKVKYPELYNKYVSHFVELGKKYNYCF